MKRFPAIFMVSVKKVGLSRKLREQKIKKLNFLQASFVRSSLPGAQPKPLTPGSGPGRRVRCPKHAQGGFGV